MAIFSVASIEDYGREFQLTCAEICAITLTQQNRNQVEVLQQKGPFLWLATKD